jgi:hypothetical protein
MRASFLSPDNAIVMTRDDPDPDPDILPRHFSFYLGRYSGGSCMVRWDGTFLHIEKTEGGNFSGISRCYRPRERQWREFWTTAEDLGVWSWEKSYSAPHGCCGVTYWQITLTHGGRTLSSSGEDLFPDGAGPGLSPAFIALIDAIRDLCRE